MTGSDGSGVRRSDWATLPNLITVVRLVLVAPIAALVIGHTAPVLAVVLLVVFGATDWVDGWVARRTGTTSAVGAVLDPIADRAGLVLIAVALVVGGYLPAWIVGVVLGVDVVLGIVYLARRPVMPPVTRLGKWRTAVLMTGIGAIGFGLLPGLAVLVTIGQVVAAVGAVLHLLTGVGYLRALLTGPSHRSAATEPDPVRG